MKGDERTDVEHNYLSVKDDLEQTLPALLSDAQKSPQSMDKGLAVYHNVVALNNVLVRLQQTAQIAGGKDDAAILQEALSGVEVVRRQLADGLAAVSDDQTRALAASQAALAQEKQRLAQAEAAEAKLKAQRAAAAEDASKKPVKSTKKKRQPSLLSRPAAPTRRLQRPSRILRRRRKRRRSKQPRNNAKNFRRGNISRRFRCLTR